MINLKKLIFTSLFFFVYIQVYCQTDSLPHSPIIINVVVLDTIETKVNSTVMRMLWLNDTIKVGIQNEKIKIDAANIAKYRKAFKDSTLWRTQQDIDKLTLSIKTGAQNCYTYALERYFDKNGTFNQDLFGKYSSIDRRSAEKILNNYFKKIAEIPTRPKRNLKNTIPSDVLLAFVNKSGWAIHLVYFHEGIFYSKNGVFKPIEFQSLKKFLNQRYWDTKKIVIYKIDNQKVKSTYANNVFK